MSFAGAFLAIARRHGEEVELYLDGDFLGRGLAVLRPVLTQGEGLAPTGLGVRRQEEVLCLGQGALPFAPELGEMTLRAGEEDYDVVNARAVEAGQEVVYWRAMLKRRESGWRQ